MEPLFIGYDLGTKRAKGIVVSSAGRIITETVSGHETSSPGPGMREQNPVEWWEEFTTNIRILLLSLRGAGFDPADISGIGITGFVPALILLGDGGSPLRPALLHTDTRASKQLEHIRELCGEELSLGTLLPKLMWVKDHEPEIYSRASTFMSAHSYLIYRCTGSIGSDFDTASIFGAVFDSGRLQYNESNIALLGLNRELFPPLLPADAVAGLTSGPVTEETGLPEGIPVIAGTGDSFASLIGDGVVRREEMMIYLGTSGTEIVLENHAADLISAPHFGPGRARFLGRIFSCGESLESARRLLGGKGWDDLNTGAGALSPGSKGLLHIPHLKQKSLGDESVRDHDIILGLRPDHGPYHLYRSVLEGIAYQVRESRDSYSGEISRIVCTGGGAESPLMKQILAAVLGTTVEYNAEGSGCLGMALLAAYASDHSKDLVSMSDAWLSRTSRIEPERAAESLYAELYPRAREYKEELDRSER